MPPPFFGTKIVDDVKLKDIEPLIDRESLFASRWQFRQGMEAEKWEAFKVERVLPVYERMMALCRANKILEPRYVYGYFKCRRDGKALIVDGDSQSFRFDLPREGREPHRSLVDFFPDGISALQVVTVGGRVVKEGARLFQGHEYSDMFFMKGLAAEAAEAVAKLCHSRIREEMGVVQNVGERFSPGYPCFPSLFDQKKIFALLKPERIGVVLTERCYMVPEYSTSAIVSVDPKAVLFRP